MDETAIVLVIASNGFQQVEYSDTKKVIEDAGFTVTTASDKAGTATAKNGSTVAVDITLDKVIPSNYAGIFFIGGPGALEHLDNTTSYKIAQETFFQNKPIGAICIATRILAKAGVLHDKYATGWNEDGELDQIFAENNVIYVPEEKVVVVDNVITATDPSVAQDFGKHIVEMLQNQQRWG
ncbi:MAG TPA: DJ-1/PfpI family protein [Candidatus Babeliales bacterium]|nr:DJ-1/PfpI family protein [Candidatus Babeliales bacterium]